MNQTIDEYWDARTKLVKAFRKLNYRLNLPVGEYRKYTLRKMSIMYELRKMDKILGKYQNDSKVYK